MKVAIAYPPIIKNGRYPLLSQNRQFRYSSSPYVKIFPLVPASAATLLKEAGHQVLWLDGVNERLSIQTFWGRLNAFSPDLVVMETKTPVLAHHWSWVKNLAEAGFKTVLMGDHVTANPEESLANSPVDYVVGGGDYDVALLGLVDHLERGSPLSAGIYFRRYGRVESSGSPQLTANLDALPVIDRELTQWHIYGEAYLHHPCAYILTGRGCGGGPQGPGRCAFCVWQHTLWQRTRRLRSPKKVVQEIKTLAERYRVREVFDDNESGGVWNQEWLEAFCQEMKREGLVGRVYFSCNARGDSLTPERCRLMKEGGFRLLKVGLESGNEETLLRLHKGESLEDIVRGVKTAKEHGLCVLLTTMTGYPWEKEEDAEKTYQVTKKLMLYNTQLGDSLQSSVLVPYPGTPLYRECLERGWFDIDPRDYSQYDMSHPVLRCSFDAMAWCDQMWNIHKHPLFLLKTLLQVRSRDDITLLGRGVTSLLGHNKDF
ncbi:MAG: radical SAM protein [Chloroflexi bacterium]|nr:radical SAM protein [Chloroflexota bacterium]